ncbi:hypothetical protein HYE68_000050 [Fusarium pseudograminearum]|nr:hypothetical protein HYE68_000050 [Fusarium pseudograminearum]
MIEIVDHIETPTPVVRLQVWHLDRRGQSRVVNKQLMEHLAKTTLFQDWSITPSLACATRDHYVPIEVDLAFRKTGDPDQESSDVSLRWNFNNNLATKVQSFFQERATKPIQMNVFPVDRNLANEIRLRFTNFHLFFSLELDFSLTIGDSLGIDRNGLTETLRVAGCAFNAHASLMSNGVDITGIGKEILTGKLTIGQLWLSLKEKMANTPLSQQLAMHYGNDAANSDEDMEEVKTCWQESLRSLEIFQSLAGQIKTYISNIIGDRAAVSKEEVHLALIQTNLATIAFAGHRKNVMQVLKKLEGRYNKRIRSSRYLVGFAFLVIVVAGVTLTGGMSTPWLVAAASSGCGSLGVGVGIDQSLKWNKTYKKEHAVNQFNETVINLADALKDAKIGLASIYCSDILQMPLQSMGTRERIEILRKLGIDIKELKHESFYSQELIETRLRRFSRACDNFEDEREAVKRDAQLKELVEPRPRNVN